MKVTPIILYLSILISWSTYRFLFTLPDAIDEVIVKPMIWLLPLFIYIGRKKLSYFSRQLIPKKNAIPSIVVGVTVGLIFSAARILTNYYHQGKNLVVFSDLTIPYVMAQVLVSCATSISEETLFRGYFLTWMFDQYSNQHFANGLTTILFMMIHFPIVIFVYQYNFTVSLMYFIIIAIVSLVSGWLYFRYRHIAAPVAFHATWNSLSALFI